MSNISNKNLPKHIAFIMDGNGRWAQERGLSRLEGHERGVDNAQEILDAAREIGIKYLTLYAFSTENWSRPQEEVKGLMNLLEGFLGQYLKDLVKNEVCLRVIGRYKELPSGTVVLLEDAIERTSEFDKQYLILALNYSSRTEIVDCVRRYIESGRNQENLEWKDLEEYLDTAGIPDPDLIIRTSGERRLSNFLLLQGAYSEMMFPEVYWPDFGREAFFKAIEAYLKRERRFGKTGDQIKESFLAERL